MAMPKPKDVHNLLVQSTMREDKIVHLLRAHHHHLLKIQVTQIIAEKVDQGDITKVGKVKVRESTGIRKNNIKARESASIRESIHKRK